MYQVGNQVVLDSAVNGIVTEVLPPTNDGNQRILLEVMSEGFYDDKPPYLQFNCESCKTIVELKDVLSPGDAAVLKCDNCGESWTVLQPSLEVHKTAEYAPIWPFTSQ